MPEMKLIVQIPCLNEEANIGQVLDEIPRFIPGVDTIETLIVDDGSTDRTVEVALDHGVTHVLRLKGNRGLAHAFRAGLEEAIRLGADIIVNTDGDNQYRGADIPRLIAPILAGQADCVIGVRNVRSIPHFSPIKKGLQLFGSWTVRKLSSTNVLDATSGFRAFTREAAASLDLVTDYTYTLESLIALGKNRAVIAQIPIETNNKQRESRLIRSVRQYVLQCGADMIRIYIRYECFKTFAFLGALAITGGLLCGLYYAVDRFIYHGRSMVALAFFSLLITAGLLFIMLGFLGDGIASNRRLLNAILKQIRLNPPSKPPPPVI
jgi:glycosyltransferase involved in cell wall biosynthesis